MINLVGLTVFLLRGELGVSHIVSEMADGQTRPVALIEEAGGGPQPSSLMPDRITIGDLQIRVWADTKAEAWNLVSSISSALHQAPRTNPVHSQGTLVKVEPLAPVYIPDEDWKINGHPGPRYEQTVRMRAHG